MASRSTNKNALLQSRATWQSLIQLVRYGALGVLTNAAGYMLYLGVTYLGVGSKMAMTVLYCIGVCISFIGNRNWVFRSNTGMLGTTIRYIAAYLIGYIINFSILVVFVDRIGYPHAIVQAVSIIVVAIFLFISFKLFVFLHVDAANGSVE